jgi:molecular chaperone DnaK (HSP70)
MAKAGEDDISPPLSPGRSVGIDLGTTNSAVAVIRDGKPFIIPNAEGQPTTPSVVAYRTDAVGNLTILVGREAEAQAEDNPTGTFASVKRVIGRKRADIPNAAVSPTLRAALEQAEGGEIRIRCPAAGRPLGPEEVSAEVYRRRRALLPNLPPPAAVAP